MKPALEFAGFVTLAAALHLGLWAGLPAGGAQSAGEGGTALVSLEAAPGALQALADAWRRPPEAQQAVAPPDLTAPPAPRETVLPRPADPAPRLSAAAPAAPAAPAALPGPAAPPSDAPAPPPPAAPAAPPAPPPEPPPPRPAPAPPPAPPQKAAGSGGRQAAGDHGPAEVSTAEAALHQSEMARWKSAIGAAIERRKRYPRGTRAAGRVQLGIVITRQGDLASVTVTRSSGSALLDEAALSTVRRARLPAAPKALSEPRYSFSLSLSLAP